MRVGRHPLDVWWPDAIANITQQVLISLSFLVTHTPVPLVQPGGCLPEPLTWRPPTTMGSAVMSSAIEGSVIMNARP